MLAPFIGGVTLAGGGPARARSASAPPLGGCGAVRLPERKPPVKGVPSRTRLRGQRWAVALLQLQGPEFEHESPFEIAIPRLVERDTFG